MVIPSQPINVLLNFTVYVNPLVNSNLELLIWSIYCHLHNYRYGDESQQWRLIYRASRDGFSARQFHVYCDNIEPTFVIVKVNI